MLFLALKKVEKMVKITPHQILIPLIKKFLHSKIFHSPS